tara:strand:- start:2755 stop:4734 length:1980 start_codon:yes stop_codon:yes gene_type:complete
MTASKLVLNAASGVGGGGLDVDDVFSVDVRSGTGHGNAWSVNNGIDLSGEGGLVFYKSRTQAQNWIAFDTERGKPSGYDGLALLYPNATNSNQNWSWITQFNNNGFSGDGQGSKNDSNNDYASWTFRKAKKFFDVVTYTGDGSNYRNISHNLGSVPGHVMVKKTSGGSVAGWINWHRTFSDYQSVFLNTTEATYSGGSNGGVFGQASGFTSTQFQLGGPNNITYHNENGSTYVAYLFAHNNNDGEFGPDGDQDIIKCGSYTGDGTTDGSNQVTLGFEPQWIFLKRSDGSGYYSQVIDSMRGMVSGGNDKILWPNVDAVENGTLNSVDATATGFSVNDSGNSNLNGSTWIYMAIRRGPLAVPEDATKVFSIDTQGSSAPYFDSNHIVDTALVRPVGSGGSGGGGAFIYARLMGEKYLKTSGTNAEANASEAGFDFMNGHIDQNWGGTNTYSWMWKRAPSYFDCVCYSGTGSARTQSHNLNAVPEMMWVRPRNLAENWAVYHKDVGATKYLQLNTTAAEATSSTRWNDTTPTSSVFSLGADNEVNASGGYTYIAYLFASVAGVSKVGSYTGDGNTGKQIDCGFSSGARFILIKASSGSGGWFVWDSVRGIVSGNDPYLQLNNTDAEVTGGDNVDPYSAGFIVNGPGNNASGVTYIFYAIAT